MYDKIHYKKKKIIHLPMQEPQLCSLVGKIPWRRKWQPTPVFLPGKSHEQRSLVDCSPWGCKRVRHNSVTINKKLWWRRVAPMLGESLENVGV